MSSYISFKTCMLRLNGSVVLNYDPGVRMFNLIFKYM